MIKNVIRKDYDEDLFTGEARFDGNKIIVDCNFTKIEYDDINKFAENWKFIDDNKDLLSTDLKALIKLWMFANNIRKDDVISINFVTHNLFNDYDFATIFFNTRKHGSCDFDFDPKLIDVNKVDGMKDYKLDDLGIDNL